MQYSPQNSVGNFFGTPFAFVDLFDDFLSSEQGQHHEEEHGGDFIAEARDWAGELISAQTMMGKILVTIICCKTLTFCLSSILNILVEALGKV